MEREKKNINHVSDNGYFSILRSVDVSSSLFRILRY